MKSTVVDESLSYHKTNVLFQRILQDFKINSTVWDIYTRSGLHVERFHWCVEVYMSFVFLENNHHRHCHHFSCDNHISKVFWPSLLFMFKWLFLMWLPTCYASGCDLWCIHYDMFHFYWSSLPLWWTVRVMVPCVVCSLLGHNWW